jgi:ADP-ribose pyrophosphatase YjhB (NUDIX family)
MDNSGTNNILGIVKWGMQREPWWVMWHKVPSIVRTEPSSVTGLEETMSDQMSHERRSPESRAQDDDKAVAGEVEAITTEPLCAEPVPRPRTILRARKLVSFMWHKVPSIVRTEPSSVTGLEETMSDQMSHGRSLESRAQDDDKAVAGEVEAITAEPLCAEPVPRPRTTLRARKLANFFGNLIKQLSGR